MAKKRTFPIECEIDGVRYAGTFTLEADSIEVSLPGHGTKTAPLDGATAQSIGRLMLGELVAEKKLGAQTS